MKIGTTYRFWKLFLFLGMTFLLSNCGRTISPDNPIRREKIGDGTSRKILVEDKFSMPAVGKQMLELYNWILNGGEKPKYVDVV